MDGVNTSLPQMEVQAGDLGKDLGRLPSEDPHPVIVV